MNKRKKNKVKVEVKEDGTLIFTLPFIKPRNKELPKGIQKHEDKRKKRKYKHKEIED